jgi:hypothetical protein
VHVDAGLLLAQFVADVLHFASEGVDVVSVDAHHDSDLALRRGVVGAARATSDMPTATERGETAGVRESAQSTSAQSSCMNLAGCGMLVHALELGRGSVSG